MRVEQWNKLASLHKLRDLTLYFTGGLRPKSTETM